MAVYNEILAGRYNRTIQKLLMMKGEAPSPSLAGEIAFVFPFFYGAEIRYLEGWNKFGQVISQAAVAAQTSQIRLRNPTASGVVAVIEKIFVTNLGGATDAPVLSHGATGGDLGTIISSTGFRLDSRGNPQPSLILSTQAAAGSPLPANLWNANLTVNSSVDIINTDIQEFPLLPGDGIHWQSGIVNQIITMAVWWRERALEDAEKF